MGSHCTSELLYLCMNANTPRFASTDYYCSHVDNSPARQSHLEREVNTKSFSSLTFQCPCDRHKSFSYTRISYTVRHAAEDILAWLSSSLADEPYYWSRGVLELSVSRLAQTSATMLRTLGCLVTGGQRDSGRNYNTGLYGESWKPFESSVVNEKI